MLFNLHHWIQRAMGASLLAGLGLALVQVSPLLVSAEPSANSLAVAQQFPLKDGIYLYGQSPQPEQLGQDYMVFRVEQGKVKGAFYRPRSEYNCFSGQVTPTSLNLMVKGLGDEPPAPYAIALQPLSPTAASNSSHTEFQINGFHQIKTVSEMDQKILKVCLSQ